MNKLTLMLMSVMLLVSTALAVSDSVEVAVPSAPYYNSVDEAKAAITDDRYILVEFYADW